MLSSDQNTTTIAECSTLITRMRRNIVLPLSITATLLLTACGGSGDPSAESITGDNNNNNPGNTSLLASPDTVNTDMGSAIIIPVLANDSGVTESALLNIEVSPSNGSASVMANNTINYNPDPTFTGKESFSYRVSLNESSAIATVTINVACSSCSKEVSVSLSWEPTKNDDDIGYKIFYGTDQNNISTLAYDLTLSTGLDPNAPAVEFSAQNDLNLNSGDSVCFQVSAYTALAKSNLSDPVCGVL